MIVENTQFHDENTFFGGFMKSALCAGQDSALSLWNVSVRILVAAGLSYGGVAIAGKSAGGAHAVAKALPTFLELTSLSTEDCSKKGAELKAESLIKRWKIQYETVDAFGKPILASALLALPIRDAAGSDSAEAFKKGYFVYNHGTVFSKNDVPSRGVDGVFATCLYASLNHAMVMPDYVGLGDSPGMQTYLHAPTAASAGHDALLASRTILAQLGTTVGKDVLIAGYSQGGHVSLALMRYLESLEPQDFVVRAVAPMAGPYSLSQASFEASLSDPAPYDSVQYAFLIMAAYHSIYGNLLDSPAKVFQAPFDEIAKKFLSEKNATERLALPEIPSQLFTSKYMEKLLDKQNPSRLQKLLAKNDLLDFTPKAPLHFWYAGADKVVTPQNAFFAKSFFAKQGVEVQLTNVGDTLNHGTGAKPSMMGARSWFVEILGDK
jgi:pimeloyl-ACP methyl ester carboxylesterase